LWNNSIMCECHILLSWITWCWRKIIFILDRLLWLFAWGCGQGINPVVYMQKLYEWRMLINLIWWRTDFAKFWQTMENNQPVASCFSCVWLFHFWWIVMPLKRINISICSHICRKSSVPSYCIVSLKINLKYSTIFLTS